MRPPGEVNRAILQAAGSLAYVDAQGRRRGPSLREMAATACVGIQAARRTVDNLRRAGQLEPVADRKVDYRNKPVIEYAPKMRAPEVTEGFVDLGDVCALWAQG